MPYLERYGADSDTAESIDVAHKVINRWRWLWLDEESDLKIPPAKAGKGKSTEPPEEESDPTSIKFEKWCKKLTKPGYCFCVVCNKELSVLHTRIGVNIRW